MSEKAAKKAAIGKKASKNAIENRQKKFVDPRGEPIMVMTLGKKRLLFVKDGIFVDKAGVVVEIE